MTSIAKKEVANPQKVDKIAKNIRFNDIDIFEHFISIPSWADQIALLSSVQDICARMEAHLEQVMEKENTEMKGAVKIAEILKEHRPDSN